MDCMNWIKISDLAFAIERLKFYIATTRKDGNAYYAVVVTPNIKFDLIFSPALYSL